MNESAMILSAFENRLTAGLCKQIELVEHNERNKDIKWSKSL